LAECDEYSDTTRSAYQFPDEEVVVNRAVLEAALVFRDGSQLFVRTTFDYQAAIREYDYAYVYYDAHGNRIFQYDDAPHHPEIATHPHHVHHGAKSKRGQIFSLDVRQVDFITIVSRVIERLKKAN